MEYYLIHHGIIGQKWGVRRYQNEDGSLTDAGRKHYGKVGERFERSLNRRENRQVHRAVVKQKLAEKAYKAEVKSHRAEVKYRRSGSAKKERAWAKKLAKQYRAEEKVQRYDLKIERKRQKIDAFITRNFGKDSLYSLSSKTELVTSGRSFVTNALGAQRFATKSTIYDVALKPNK